MRTERIFQFIEGWREMEDPPRVDGLLRGLKCHWFARAEHGTVRAGLGVVVVGRGYWSARELTPELVDDLEPDVLGEILVQSHYNPESQGGRVR